MKTLEGNVIGKGLKVGIVAARFNEFIVNKLIGGAEDALVRHGVDTKDVECMSADRPSACCLLFCLSTVQESCAVHPEAILQILPLQQLLLL